jgi:hypothetical protein
MSVSITHVNPEQTIRKLKEKLARLEKAQRKPLTDGREEFKQYLDECDKYAIVPDVAGSFNAGWLAAHGIKDNT